MDTRRRTALQDMLGSSGLRGAVGGSDKRPVAAAVVVGVGGSGIQTVARLRSALAAGRAEQAAIDAVQILGIDAINLDGMVPPLPPNVGLGGGSFFNITENPFDASKYVKNRLGNDKFLDAWWDHEYQPPSGTLTEGLKRERMLGRLAFHRVRQQLVNEIGEKMSSAVDLDQGFLGAGGAGIDAPKIPIYIVASSSGGTGSAGFLEVVFAIWRAAAQKGYHPEIRAFLYLPGVFHGAVVESQGGLVAAEAQQANAYAFFMELDHFCARSSELAGYFGLPVDQGGPDIPDGDLLKQVYVIDNKVRGQGEISRTTDMYEITAESLFHFLASDVGMRLVGADAANTEQALELFDHWGKPRRYCSLGIARVVFPGDTYRQHLTMGYVDWFLRSGILAVPSDLDSIIRDHEVVTKLLDRIDAVDAESGVLDNDDFVEDFLRLREVATDELTRVPEAGEAEKLIERVKRLSPQAVRAVQSVAASRNRALLGAAEDAIEEEIFRSGYGIAFSREALRLLMKRIGSIRDEADARSAQNAVGRAEAEQQVQTLLKELYAANRRSLHERVAAKIGSVIGKAKDVNEIAQQLGRAIQSWVQATYDAELSNARLDLLSQMAVRVEAMGFELERAREVLNELAEDARDYWSQDELLGKDAGPRATTTLIPGDAQPEVENSRYARQWLTDIKLEHGHVLGGDALVEFFSRWRREEENRGLFSLGSTNEGERAAAERSLVGAMLRDGKDRALFRGVGDARRIRLPADLNEAAEKAQDLTNAIDGLATLSQSVCWSWEEGRLNFRHGNDAIDRLQISPEVTTVVACHRSVDDLVGQSVRDNVRRELMDDPERIVALSCEWAVPIHALHVVEGWRATYLRLRNDRREGQGRGRVAPSHIDRRFEEKLRDLIPVYFDAEEIGKLIGQAFVFGTLLQQQNDRVLAAYESSRAKPALALISQSNDGEFVGHVIRVTDGTLKVDREQAIQLGQSWDACLQRLGSEPRLRASITAVASWLVELLGPDETATVVHDYVEQRLAPLLDRLAQNRSELEAVSHVYDGLGNWEVWLRNLAATGR